MTATEIPPVPRHYTKTVAARSFFARGTCEEFGVLVEFGEPIQDVPVVHGTDWRCPLRLTVGTDVTVRSITGIDSFQALRLAIDLARVELELIATRPGVVLFYLDEPIDTSKPDWLRAVV